MDAAIKSRHDSVRVCHLAAQNLSSRRAEFVIPGAEFVMPRLDRGIHAFLNFMPVFNFLKLETSSQMLCIHLPPIRT